MTLKFFIFVFCSCYLSVNASIMQNNNFYRLDIVHYNDFHVRFEETSVKYPVCEYNNNTCIGGFARLYYQIQALVQERPEALVLNAGDVFSGTYWYTLLKWNVTQHFIKMIKHDAHTLGNHEFDDGIPGLVPYLRALNQPVVAANVETPTDSELHGLYKPHIIVTKNGRQIGIIGVITNDTKERSRADGVSFLNPIEVVEREAQLLTSQGVDIILVLSHCGYDVDREIARQAGQNIDIIVGGHSHFLQWNETSGPSGEKTDILGYPIVEESQNNPGHKVLLVTSSAFTKYLGNISVYFDDQGNWKHFEGAPIFLNRSIPEDPNIKALLKPYTDNLHKMFKEVVGHSKGNLNDTICSAGECELGNLITDAILDSANKVFTSGRPSISFIPRNIIRAPLPEGNITRGAIINMEPFSNKVVTFVIRGDYIIEALKRCVKNLKVEDYFSGSYTPMVSGIQLKINITSVEVLEALVRSGSNVEKFDSDQFYQLTTFDFLAIYFFTDFKQHGTNWTLMGYDRDVIEEYIRRKSPITPYLDNRLTLVY